MRTIAFDIGTKRIGLAISDPSGMVASPLMVYTRGEDPERDARELADIARENEAERIVVGMPIDLRGRRGPAAEQVQEFVDLLAERADVEIVAWDERMTTVIAERSMIEGDVSRRKRREKIDSVAAAVLLQNYLDASGGGSTAKANGRRDSEIAPTET